LIDPGQLTAKQLYRQLFIGLQLRRGEPKNPPVVDKIFLSMPAPTVDASFLTSEGALTSEYKYGRVAGRTEVEDTRYIPLSRELLPRTLIDLLKRNCPNTWKAVPEL
jgi:hypothetical protein